MPSSYSDHTVDVDKPLVKVIDSFPGRPTSDLADDTLNPIAHGSWRSDATLTHKSVSTLLEARRKKQPGLADIMHQFQRADNNRVAALSIENDKKDFSPPNNFQNIVFIYPSSMNTMKTHSVSVDPTYGVVFTSNVISPEKRRYNFFYLTSERPTYCCDVLPTLSIHLLGWVPVVTSWRVPLSLRVQCGKDSGKDKCLEDILDILFHPYFPFVWSDIELDLNTTSAGHFLHNQEQIKGPIGGVIRVTMETTKCSTDAASKLLTKMQSLPNVKELKYGYEFDNRHSLHFKRGRFCSMMLWSNLNVVDMAGELDEADCISLIKQCVRASSITLRSLVNRNKDSEIIRHKHIALDFDTLCAIPPPVSRPNERFKYDTKPSACLGDVYTILPMLKALSLAPSLFDTVDVLKHFTFPRLERLGFATVLTANPDTLDNIQELLLRSRAPLVALDVYDMYLGPPTVARLLRAVFVGTLSLSLDLDDSLGARRLQRHAVTDFTIHFLSVLGKKKRPVIPHEAAYRKFWKKELAMAMADMPVKSQHEVVVPDLYIAASQYGELKMNVGWGTRLKIV